MKNRDLQEGRYYSLYETGLGCGGVVASDEGLLEVFLPFAGSSREKMLAGIAERYPLALGESPLTKEAAARLTRYCAGENVVFTFPIDRTRFTPFQRSVYEAVTLIPYGAVKSYGEVAVEIGRPQGARGIGQAMARNPLPVVIPCHRVVGAAGAMTGYSAPGGVVSKKWLLRMEGVDLTSKEKGKRKA